MPVFRLNRRLKNNGKAVVINRDGSPTVLSISQSAGVPPLRYELLPGEVCEVDENYARRIEHANGAVTVSTVERLTGHQYDRPGKVVPLETEEGRQAFERFNPGKRLVGTKIMTIKEAEEYERQKAAREAARKHAKRPMRDENDAEGPAAG